MLRVSYMIHGIVYCFSPIRILRYKFPALLPVQVLRSSLVVQFGPQWFLNGYEQAENTTK